MVFEGIGAGQRYKKPRNVSRKGTAAPTSQPGMLRLLEMGSCGFYSRKWCRSGKLPGLYCRIFFVAVLEKAGIAAAHPHICCEVPISVTEGAVLRRATAGGVPDHGGWFSGAWSVGVCWPPQYGGRQQLNAGCVEAAGVTCRKGKSVSTENGCATEPSDSCFGVCFGGGWSCHTDSTSGSKPFGL